MTEHSSAFQIDEQDPRFIILYEGEQHPEPADYRFALQRWVTRLEECERTTDPVPFGVIIVHGQHDHDHEDGEEHARDGDKEAEFTKLINDFRRDYRDRIAACCSGYANVYAAEDIARWYGDGEAGLVQLRANLDRFAQYTFGIPGNGFPTLAAAQAWLTDQAALVVQSPISQSPNLPISNSVGIFYGSTTGVTEYVAEQIAAVWQTAHGETLLPINITDLEDAELLTAYDLLILGIPTWNIGQLQDDWELLLPELADLNFQGKQVALFGVGDAHGYPDNFLDAVGMLGEVLRGQGAHLIGAWPTAGYDFTASKAVQDERFMGLAIDEVNQAEQTLARIAQWVAQIGLERLCKMKKED